MHEVSSDTRAVSTLDRQSLAATPYGLLSSTKSIVDQGVVDEHPQINPASDSKDTAKTPFLLPATSSGSGSVGITVITLTGSSVVCVRTSCSLLLHYNRFSHTDHTKEITDNVLISFH